MASIATNELEPPALLRGFGGKRESVDFVAQVVASIDFELPVQSCGFGSECEVNAKDLRNRNVVVDAPPPPCPPSPPIDALPLTPSRSARHRRLQTWAEVDGDVEDAGANGTVKDNDVGDKDNASKFVAVELNSEVDRMTKTMMFPSCRATDRAAVYL